MKPNVFRALSFASGADRVEFGAAATGGRLGLTVETWVRPAVIGEGNRPLVWQKSGFVAPYAWALYVTYDGRLYMVVWDAADVVNVSYSRPGAVRAGLWQHVAAVYDVDYAAIILWVDGRDVTEDSDMPGEATQGGGEAVQLGGYMQDPDLGFIGEIGWGRISGTARYETPFSPSPVARPVDAATLLQWDLDEGAGAVAHDAGGVSALDGAIYGATWSIWPPVGARPLTVWPRPEQGLSLGERRTAVEIGRRFGC